MSSQVPSRAQSYFILTYGCQMNDNDSEIMAGILEARGFERAASEQDADVVIVNTCVVREGAEERALGRLAQFAAIKRRKPHLVVAVAGCMAQKDGRALLEKVPHADLVVGTRDLFKLGSLLDEVQRSGEQLVAIEDLDKPVFLDAHPVRRKSGLKALVTIMYGCDNFCSYCIVPTTRGREVSRPVADIITEVTELTQQGYREVMLLGQNVNSYSHEGVDFPRLLERVAVIPGMSRIRFMTSHPKDCSEDLIRVVAAHDNICTNFHLPAQAGADSVLRRMNRRYTRQQYLDLVGRVRELVPHAAISTDIIVGFPGETAEDFDQTYDLFEQARWDSAFIFMYSIRQGTPAARLKDDVPLADKKRRLQKCLARQEEISGEINRGYIGSVQQVLVESVSKRNAAELVGRTVGDKNVIFAAPQQLIGQLVDVEITSAYPHTLFGQCVSPVTATSLS